MKDAIEINRDRTAGALSERAAIVAWLRALKPETGGSAFLDGFNAGGKAALQIAADAIESGEHLPKGEG